MTCALRSTVFLVLTLAAVLPGTAALAGDVEFREIQHCFRNFMDCEMHRTDSNVYFEGKSFEIVDSHVADARQEGDLLVVTGTVTCWVEKKPRVLFAVLGIRTIMGHRQVGFVVIRDQDFSIPASELLQSPYKRECPWIRFRVPENQ